MKQSLATFRRVLMDWNFGELYYSGHIPDNKDYLFVTIQTFNSQKFYEEMPKDYYDYIVIDEFHHAAALSYQALLDYYEPQI
ncbi:MAG: DEAD/DEAH box helicase family protein, partial [Cellulosilyticaceae bacterium]